MKRIISVILAVVMLMSVAMISASAAKVEEAATGTSGMVYFDATGWNNVTKVYCHIWVRGGDSFYGWASKDEECEQIDSSLWGYDLAKLDASTTVSGGMKSGVDYCIIFSANTKVQTYDMTFGLGCVDDIAYITGDKIENPVDSQKTAFGAAWTDNGSKYGSHLAITSIGNIVGKVLCPNEKGYAVIGDWLPTYYASPNVDPVKALTSAFPKFSIDTVEELALAYAYIEDNAKDLKDKDLATCKSQLEKAFAAAYPDKVKEAEKNNDGKNDGGLLNEETIKEAQNNVDQSGTGKDGVDPTFLFTLLAVMLVASVAVVATRKKREE